MLPRSTRLIVAVAALLLVVHACIQLGGVFNAAAVAFCAFALMIGGPIAILVWFGSVVDVDEKRRSRRSQLAHRKSEALVFERTLLEIEASAWPPLEPATIPESRQQPTSGKRPAPQYALARVADALRSMVREGKRATRPILALWLAAVSAVGLAGCGGVPPEAWAAVRPGMGTTELVSLVGGPDYIRSNGTAEVWQYCRDFPGLIRRDEGRNARYYTAILVDRQTVREVQPYPVLSDAGCEDFYRAEF